MRLSDGSSALLWEIFRDFASFGRQTGSRFLLLKGGIATGKTLFARAIACFLAGYLDANVSGLSTEEIDGAFQKALEADPRHVELLSMHRGRSYENTVYGFSLRTEGEQLRFDGGKRALLRMAGRAAADKTRQYVWILDDANRVDFSQVLGDLLSALESKDAGNAIHAGGENVTLPENLWFIATFHPTIGETPPDFAWLRRFFVRYPGGEQAGKLDRSGGRAAEERTGTGPLAGVRLRTLPAHRDPDGAVLQRPGEPSFLQKSHARSRHAAVLERAAVYDREFYRSESADKVPDGPSAAAVSGGRPASGELRRR